jgi:hypothetical protein
MEIYLHLMLLMYDNDVDNIHLNLTLTLTDVTAGMESTAVRKKMEDDENKSRSKGFDETSNALHNRNEIEKDNNRFITDQRQLTKQTINQQDEQLGHLGVAVDRLGAIGRDVNQELKEQNVMIDALETDLDDAGNKMNVVMASLSKLLKTKDGCQIWTIVILALILIILGIFSTLLLLLKIRGHTLRTKDMGHSYLNNLMFSSASL